MSGWAEGLASQAIFVGSFGPSLGGGRGGLLGRGGRGRRGQGRRGGLHLRGDPHPRAPPGPGSRRGAPGPGVRRGTATSPTAGRGSRQHRRRSRRAPDQTPAVAALPALGDAAGAFGSKVIEKLPAGNRRSDGAERRGRGSPPSAAVGPPPDRARREAPPRPCPPPPRAVRALRRVGGRAGRDRGGIDRQPDALGPEPQLGLGHASVRHEVDLQAVRHAPVADDLLALLPGEERRQHRQRPVEPDHHLAQVRPGLASARRAAARRGRTRARRVKSPSGWGIAEAPGP